METSLAIQRIITSHWKVDFWSDDSARKAAINDIDDFLFDDIKDRYGISLSLDQMDKIIGKAMQIAARHRRHS
jgi:type I restriction enzyme R subunit